MDCVVVVAMAGMKSAGMVRYNIDEFYIVYFGRQYLFSSVVVL
jgi:hypothetical protein